MLRNLVWIFKGGFNTEEGFWRHTAGENRDKYKDDDDVTADVVMSVTIQLNKAWKPHKVVARQDNQAQLFGN